MLSISAQRTQLTHQRQLLARALQHSTNILANPLSAKILVIRHKTLPERVIDKTSYKNVHLQPTRVGLVGVSLNEGDRRLDQGVVRLLVVPQIALKNALQCVTRRNVLLRHLCENTSRTTGGEWVKVFQHNTGVYVFPTNGPRPSRGLVSKDHNHAIARAASWMTVSHRLP